MGYILLTNLTTGDEAFIGEGQVVKLPKLQWACDVCKTKIDPQAGQFRFVNHPFEYFACNPCIESGKRP